VNKPEYTNNNYDIMGSCPRALHVSLNKPEFNLTNRDIQGTWPKWNKFDTTREPANPLEPTYKLQKVKYIKPDPPRFLRDAMQIDDVEGARPKKVKQLETRNSNNVSDIFGASPKKRYARKTVYNSVNYNDVTKFVPKSQRVTDPLNPTYSLRDTGTGHFTHPISGAVNKSYGAIAGS